MSGEDDAGSGRVGDVDDLPPLVTGRDVRIGNRRVVRVVEGVERHVPAAGELLVARQVVGAREIVHPRRGAD